MGIPIVFRDGPWVDRGMQVVSPGPQVIAVPGLERVGSYVRVGRKQLEGGDVLEIYYDWKQD